MKTKNFPIRDIQFHEEGLREAAGHNISTEEAIAVAWHTTAIAYLQYGEFKQVDGPAAEYEDKESGLIETRPIEDYLIPATDSHGLTFFKHTFKGDK